MKKTVLLICLICSLGITANAAFANGWTSGTTVKRLLVMPTTNPPKAYIQLNKEATGSPSCATNQNWSYILDISTPAARLAYSNLLSAQAQNKIVTVGGTGSCGTVSTIEDLKHSYIYSD